MTCDIFYKKSRTNTDRVKTGTRLTKIYMSGFACDNNNMDGQNFFLKLHQIGRQRRCLTLNYYTTGLRDILGTHEISIANLTNNS